MYLHAGNNRNIRISNIIGIFDTDTATVSSVTKKFLKSAESEGLLESASDEIPKSMILYREKNKYKICFSQLSTQSLVGRLEATPQDSVFGL